jgi:uncharacterized phage protein gp47/JayE
MTIVDGRFEDETTEAILDAMVEDAKDYWDDPLNDNSLNVVRTFYRPIADQLAQAQDDIGLVLDSTQIDHAEDTALDLLTALIGVQRDPATEATGHVTFSRDTPATSLYTIPSGTEVQTDSSDPTRFLTDETVNLRDYEDFEGGGLLEYNGDTGAFNVQSSVVLEGEHSLESSGNSGNRIIRDDIEINEGTDFQFLTRVSSGAATYTEFSFIDSDNFYRVIVDEGSGRVALNVTDGGTEDTVVEDTSAAVPAAEKIRAEVDWDRGGDFTLTFYDSSDSEFSRISGSDPTHKGGSLAFHNADDTNTKYWDFVSSTAVSVGITAEAAGVEGNTARQTIVVMPNEPPGVENVVNIEETTGGSEEEEDDELRARAKKEIGEGSRASAEALTNSVKRLAGVSSVNAYKVENDGDSDYDGFELVVEGGEDQRIADTILDTMAFGDTSWGGINGTEVSVSSEISNGETFTIDFSRPAILDLTISADLDITDDFSGKEEVQDSIVSYVGGLLSSGNDAIGLNSGEDVIYGEVEYAIRNVEGVYDVSNLTVDTDSTSGNTSNVAVGKNEVASADATDGSISLTTTLV